MLYQSRNKKQYNPSQVQIFGFRKSVRFYYSSREEMSAPRQPRMSARPKKKVLDHSKELIKAFTPIRFFLIIIGQMPFDIKKKQDNTYTFKLNAMSKSWWFFFFMFSLNITAYILVTVGIFSFILNSLTSRWIKPTKLIMVKDTVTDVNEAQLWERYHIRNEMVPVLVIWSWMTISIVGSLHVLLYGKFYVHFINYFNRVVQMMDMDMTPGIKNYLWKNNIFTLLTASGLIVGFCMQSFGFHTIGDTASVIANFVLRMFSIEMEELNSQLKLGAQIFGLIIMVSALVGSRANVLQFLFFSQLLKNGSKIWNERFTNVLETDQMDLQHFKLLPNPDQFHRRLDLKNILKDHLILVQLFRMTDAVFGFILLTFYGFEILAVVMEIYQLAALGGFHSGKNRDGGVDGDEEFNEQTDVFETDNKEELQTLSTAIVCIVLMLQHVWFAIMTTGDAATAYEQAMEGFNILRQHGFMYCRNKADRNFVLSMFMSFSKNAPMQLSAGRYFTINKTLLVAMSAAIVNWAVSIYQTKVDQWK